MPRPKRLTPGNRLPLAKINGSPVARVLLGATWKNVEFDLDLSVLLLTAGSTVPSNDHFLYRWHQRTEAGNGFVRDIGVGKPAGHDRAQAMLDLARLPSEVVRVVVAISAMGPGARPTLADAQSIMTRAMDLESGHTSVIYVQDPLQLQGQNCLLLWELRRHAGGWVIGALGRPYPGGPGKLTRDHGVVFNRK